MSFTTYVALKAAVAAWSTKQGLDAQIPDFIGWAHQEICRRLRAPVLYARADLTVNAELVSAPSDFLAPRSLYLDVTPRRHIKFTDAAQLVALTDGSSQGDYPRWAAVEGTGTIAFAPNFGGSATGKLLYYAQPPALVNDTDSNAVLTKYPFLYLYGALEALYRYMEDDNNTDRYGNLFGALLVSVNGEEAKDALRGPLTGSASGAVV